MCEWLECWGRLGWIIEEARRGFLDSIIVHGIDPWFLLTQTHTRRSCWLQSQNWRIKKVLFTSWNETRSSNLPEYLDEECKKFFWHGVGIVRCCAVCCAKKNTHMKANRGGCWPVPLLRYGTSCGTGRRSLQFWMSGLAWHRAARLNNKGGETDLCDHLFRRCSCCVVKVNIRVAELAIYHSSLLYLLLGFPTEAGRRRRHLWNS